MEEWSTSRPGLFIPGEGATGTHRIGGWVRSRDGPDAVVEEKNTQFQSGIQLTSHFVTRTVHETVLNNT